MASRLSAIQAVTPDLVVTAELSVETRGEGFTEITADVARFVQQSGAGEGALFVYLRHTSASLTIQENADPDVQTDLIAALRNVAPEDGRWVHTVEGPDDMPAHIKAMTMRSFDDAYLSARRMRSNPRATGRTTHDSADAARQ